MRHPRTSTTTLIFTGSPYRYSADGIVTHSVFQNVCIGRVFLLATTLFHLVPAGDSALKRDYDCVGQKRWISGFQRGVGVSAASVSPSLCAARLCPNLEKPDKR